MNNQSHWLVLVAALLLLLYSAAAVANPQGSEVVHGQVSISQPNPATLNITNSNGAIINWQQFSIQHNEITRFIQDSANSAILNRVVGQDPSSILGQLLSNGRVFLINPNGIVFGPNSVIDTAGLVASTLDMTDEDFINQNLKFQGTDAAADILNQGYIKAGANGDIFLIAPNIENSGIIETRGGEIILAAGKSITIASLDSDHIVFQIQAPENNVVNLGDLLTHGGAAGMFAGTIKQGGNINADTLTVDKTGKIVLSASSNITLEAGSRISASGTAGGIRDGGEVRVIAEHTLDMKHGAEVHVDGGVDGGDGGFLELSGKQQIALNGDYTGKARVEGFRNGSLLLDPTNINIITAGGDDTGGDGVVLAGDPGVTLNIDPISLLGAWTNVSLAASNDITVSAAIADGDIPVGGSFTLDAGNDISINADIGSILDFFEHDLFLLAGNTITVNAQINLQNNETFPNDLANIVAAQAVNFSPGGSININDASLAESFGVVRIHASGVGGTITMNAGSSITHTGAFSPGALIELRADDMVLGGSIAAPNIGVSLQSFNPGRELDLGSNTVGKLGLTDAELNSISADDIRLGRFDSGNVTISAPIDLASTNDLLLLVRSDIQVQPGSGITTPNLLLIEAQDVDIQAGLASNRFIIQTPFGVTTPIELGTSGPGAGVMALDQSEIDFISAGSQLQIGSFSQNAISVTAPLTIADNIFLRSQDSIFINSALNFSSYTLTPGTDPGEGVVIGSGGSLSGTGTINGDVTHTGGSLVLGIGNSVINGNYSLAPGTLTGTGNLTVTGSFSAVHGGLFDTSRISTTGTVTLQNGGAIGVTSVVGQFELANTNLINQGTLTWTGNNIAMSGGARLTNPATSTFDIQTASDIGGTAAESIDNAGTLIKSAGTANETLIFPTLNNSGVSARVHAQAGGLDLRTGGTHGLGASFDVDAGTTLRLQGSNTADATTSVTGTGNLHLSGTNNLDGAFSFSGDLSTGGGTHAIADTVAVNLLSIDTGSLTLPNTVTVADSVTLVNNGILTAPNLTSIGGAVSLNGTLDIDTDITLPSLSFTAAGNLTGSANVIVAGAFNAVHGGLFDTSRISTTGNVTLQSGGAIGVTSVVGQFELVNTNLINQGTLTWTGNNIALSGGARLTNPATSTFDIQTASDIAGTAAESIDNAGIIRKTAGTANQTIIATSLNNSGATALVDVGVGILELSTGGSHDLGAIFNVDTGATLRLQGNNNADATTSIIGTGDLALSGNSSLDGTFSLSGDLSTGGGIHTIADTVTVNLIRIDTGSLTLPNTVTVADSITLVNNGILTAPNLTSIGGAVSLNGTLDIDTDITLPSLSFTAAGNLTGSANVIVAGAFNAVHGGLFDTSRISTTGNVTLQSGGAIGVSSVVGQFELVNTNLINQGTLTWTGNPIAMTGGAKISNQSTGLFDIQTDRNISGTGVESIDNTGIFRKTAGAGVSNILSGVRFNNDGSVEVTDGVLRLSGGGIHTGEFNAQGSGRIELFGGSHDLQDGSQISGTGTVEFSSPASVSITGIGTGTSIANGTTFALNNKSIGGAGKLTNLGRLIVKGTSSFGGSLVNDTSGLLTVLADAGVDAALSTRIENRGLLELTSQTSPGDVAISGGQFLNTSTGTVSVLAGSGGARLLDAELDNWGTVNVLNTTLSLDFTDGVFYNQGLITVDGGVFDVTIDCCDFYQTTGMLNLINGGQFISTAGTDIYLQGGTFTSDGSGAIDIDSGWLYVQNPGARELSDLTISTLNLVLSSNSLILNNTDLTVTSTLNPLTVPVGSTLVLQSSNVTDTTGVLVEGVLGGIGNIIGDVTVSTGTLAAGQSPGTLNITGDLDLLPGSLVVAELGGLVQGVTYDLLDVGGNANLAGSLDVLHFGGFSPDQGAAFDIITSAGPLAGNFSSLNTPTGFGYQALAGSNTLQLLLGSVPLVENSLEFESNSLSGLDPVLALSQNQPFPDYLSMLLFTSQTGQEDDEEQSRRLPSCR